MKNYNTKTILLFLFILFNSNSFFAQATGDNDFRVSEMGTDGDANIDARRPSVAYNPALDQYLVVWYGDHAADGENEVYGQFYDAATGATIGSDFRISDMGPDGNTDYNGSTCAVVFNETSNEYLVVWRGNNVISGGSPAYGIYDIFGQRLDASGAEIGTNDFNISDIPTSNTTYGAYEPDVAWNSTDNEYMVVWYAVDTRSGAMFNEDEVYAQRLSSTGAQIGTSDFRISDMGGLGSSPWAYVYNPSIAYNSVNNEYVVVWQGTETNNSSGGNESEIYGQRLSATGGELGTNDFVLSDMGPSGDFDYQASNPDIAYNPTDNQYLVIWQGDDNTSPLVDNETEIFGQFLSNTAAEVGADFRISSMGDDSESNANVRDKYRANNAHVAWANTTQKYIVVWEGEDDTEAINDGEKEIFGRMVESDGTLLGSEIRFSEMGDEGNSNIDAGYPAVCTNGNNECLVLWEGENDIGSLVDGEREIWGQQFILSTANHTPNDIILNPATIVDGTTSSTKITDIFSVDMDLDNSFTYSLTSGDGDTDNGSFTISGSDLIANTNFDYATKDTFYIRIKTNDGTADFEKAIVITVDEPVLTLIDNNFRISVTNVDGLDDYDASNPAIAYNSTDDEFLVVWRSDHALNNKYEIYAQRVNALDGTSLGSTVRVSFQDTSDVDIDASEPAVAYNEDDNEYLVVWTSDSKSGGMIDNEQEVFAQIVEADATFSGVNFRVSDASGIGNTNAYVYQADVVYNATSNEYMVIWEADDADASGVVAGKNEIFGQRLSAAGAEIGTNDFRISTTGADGNVDFDADNPSITWNSTDNEYLVVWDSDHAGNSWQEIYGQLLNADGSLDGGNFEIISTPNSAYDADAAKAIYNPTDNKYLVGCDSDIDTDGRNDVYTQLVNADGTLDGSTLQVSNQVNGDVEYDQNDVNIAYVPAANEYLAVWRGEDNNDGMIQGENETFMQRISNTNTAVGLDDERISVQGGSGNTNAGVLSPTLAYSTTSKRALVVWTGDNEGSVIDNENEIFGQLWQSPSATLPIELVYFTAKAMNNEYVQLDWQTASEINNDFFTIEKSADGSTRWEEVDRVAGLGTSFTLNSYAIKDRTPFAGTSYYRLKQTDFDGQYAYSKVVAVHFEDGINEQVNIFPNPTNGQLTIASEEYTLGEVQFYDMMGNLVSRSVQVNSNGEHSLTVDLSQLPVGTYYLRAKDKVYQVHKF